MPKTRENGRGAPRVPTYSRHRDAQRGDRAFCYLRASSGERRRVYLGPWDSPESKRRYCELVAGYLLSDEAAPLVGAPSSDADALTVADIVARFLASKETTVSASQWSLLVYSLKSLVELLR